jgi:hypothetical protein
MKFVEVRIGFSMLLKEIFETGLTKKKIVIFEEFYTKRF